MPTGLYPRIDPITSFFKKLEITNSCWLWKGAKFGETLYGVIKKSASCEKVGSAVLSRGEVGEIRFLHSLGMSVYRLAKIFECSDCAVRGIVNNKTWRQICSEE